MLANSIHAAFAKASAEFCLELFDEFDQEFSPLVDQALDRTNSWHQRDCPLKATLMVYYTVMLALNRSDSMGDVFKILVDKCRGRNVEVPLKPVTCNALVKARCRLGPAPLEVLFKSIGLSVAPKPSFHGLRTWGVDGVEFSIPDTPENEAVYGRQIGSRGQAAFPHSKLVALVDTTTRGIRDAVLGPYRLDERHALEELLDHLGSEDLLFADAGFSAAWLFEKLMARGIHFLFRISDCWKPHHIRWLGKGDSIVRIDARDLLPLEEQTKKRKSREIRIELRMIEYKIGENKRIRLLTDLFDSVSFPALDLARAYHQRWEVEMTYDEFKTHLSTVTHGTLHTTLRSRTPGGVRQEAFAALTAYNLIRALMAKAGETHGVPPLYISFVETLKVIKLALPRFESANQRERESMAELLLQDIAACPIDRPRRKRVYPRKVKLKMSNFGLKRDSDRGERRDFAAELKLQSSKPSCRKAR